MSNYTHRQIADYLRYDFWDYWTGSAGRHHSYTETDLTVDITDISPHAQQLARLTLEHYENITQLNFTEVSNGAHITFHEPATNEAYGGVTSWTPNPDGGFTILSSSVTIGSLWLDPQNTVESSAFGAYVHEIGHALGLGHAGPYSGSATYGTDNVYYNDSAQATIMSYFSQSENWNVNATDVWRTTPQVADIMALQDMYGAGNARSGDTTYGYNTNTLHELYDATQHAENVGYTIWDAGGIDTLDYSGSSTNDRIDLRAAERNSAELFASDVWGEVGNVMIAPGVVIENAVGGAGDNVIIGNAAGNRLEGGAGRDRLSGLGGDDDLDGGPGADLLDGGAGAMDRAIYIAGAAGVTVDLAGLTSNTGDAAGDSFRGIEGLVGSQFADTISGDGGANGIWGAGGNDYLNGRSGNDALAGGGGNDRIYGAVGNDQLGGGSGNDRLSGGAGVDSLIGGAGHDDLLGGAGADAMKGGNGNDRALYVDATSGVTADLAGLTSNTGDAAGDSFSGIEGLVGSQLADVISGDGGANGIWGAEGNDYINGRSGNDALAGGGGNDRIYGAVGEDRLAGGPGRDLLSGGAGADGMIGGSGADRFFFRTGDDSDVVGDFAVGVDTLVLDEALWEGFLTPAGVIDSFASLEGDDAVFDFGAGDTVALLDVGTLALEDDILIA